MVRFSPPISKVKHIAHRQQGFLGESLVLGPLGLLRTPRHHQEIRVILGGGHKGGGGALPSLVGRAEKAQRKYVQLHWQMMCGDFIPSCFSYATTPTETVLLLLLLLWRPLMRSWHWRSLNISAQFQRISLVLILYMYERNYFVCFLPRPLFSGRLELGESRTCSPCCRRR